MCYLKGTSSNGVFHIIEASAFGLPILLVELTSLSLGQVALLHRSFSGSDVSYIHILHTYIPFLLYSSQPGYLSSLGQQALRLKFLGALILPRVCITFPSLSHLSKTALSLQDRRIEILPGHQVSPEKVSHPTPDCYCDNLKLCI